MAVPPKAQTPEVTIPNDLGACQALLVELAKIIQEQKEQLAEQQLEINELMRRAFQRRSERYLANPEQMLLDFGETPEAGDAAEGLADAKEELIHVLAYTRRQRGQRPARNEQLPAHLPRRELPMPVPADMHTCPTHGQRQVIGYDVSETLMFERPKLWVAVRKYPKYVCAGAPACGVQEPSRPASLVEGNRYDTSVAAEIITAKSGYHLPIYRQQDLFAGCGWTPSRGTLLNRHSLLTCVPRFSAAAISAPMTRP
jgi:transposase